MKFSSYWYVFTLLATAQLLLVLLGVVYLFRWFETTEMAAIRVNTIANTEAVALQVADTLKSGRKLASISEQSSRSSVTRFRKAVSTYEPVNGGFVCFLRASDGKVLYQKNGPANINERLIGQMRFQPHGGGRITSLLSVFAEQTERSIISGMLSIDGQKWLGSATLLPTDDAIVLATQNESIRMYRRAVNFNEERTSTLIWAMLLSFVVIAVPIIGLFHNDDNLRAVNENLERQATHNERELVRTRNAVIFGLAKLAESRDNDTGEHLERIRKYVEILSNDLAEHFTDIDEEFTRNLSLASSLHDIGKVGIPDSILLKPGRLTPEERSVMQIHTLIGGECLDAIHARLGDNQFMHMARQIAYYHHERWDGEGYPHQLSGDEIPLVARIVAVADVYDALTSKRPYKRAMSHLESRAIVLAGSGSQFDPEVVAAFIRHEHKFEAISRGQQSLSDAEATSRFVKLHELATAGSKIPGTSS